MSSRKIFELFGSIVVEGLGTAKKEFTEFQKDLKATNKALNKMGRDAGKLGKAITKGLTVPLGIAGGAVIKFGADFDQAMTNSLAIMGDVSDEMRNKLEMTAREVAKTTKFSATQAAESYYFLASAGLDAAQSMALLPKVAAFAQAGNFDMAKATDLLTDAQSALGLSSDDAATHMANLVSISDQFTRAASNANATSQQFSEGITNKAGVALKDLGKDLSEGLAILQVYADKGLAKGVDAGTQLNIVLRDLQNASVNNTKAWKDAEVAVFDGNGKMMHMADIVEGLTGHLSGMSDEQKRSELLMLGFTSKSMDATKALLGTSDAIRDFEKRTKEGITTQEVADKQMKTFWVQLGLVKDKVVDLGLTLWKGLAPILMDVVLPAITAVTEAMAWFINLMGEHKNITAFIATFVGVLAVAGPFLLFFAKILPMIKSMVALYKVLTAAQIGLNASMTANPIGLIVVGIAALIAAGVLLWRNWDAVKKAFVDTWDFISYHFKNVSSTIAMAYGSMILGILDGINKIARFIPGINKGLGSLIESVENTVDALAAQKAARIALHKVQVANKKLTLAEKKATDEAAKALKEINGSIKTNTTTTEDNTDAKDKNKAATLKQIEAAKKLAEEKAKFEDEWNKKLEEATSSRQELLLAEKTHALAEAEKLGVDKTNILKFYANEELKISKDKAKSDFKISKELNKAKAGLEDDSLTKLRMVTQQKLTENEFEKTEAIRIGTEKGLDLANITELYKAREIKIIRDSAVIEVKIANDVKREKISTLQKVLSAVGNVAGQMNAVWQAGLNRRMIQLDKETEAKTAAMEEQLGTDEEHSAAIEEIKNNELLSDEERSEQIKVIEEERAAAIAAIDEEADAKKLELQKENARREKLASIMGIVLNTALAVSAALTLPPPASFIMAGITAALGIAQLAIAVATPIPFAKGGLVRSDPGTGIIAQIGEGAQDEVVLPMKTGALEIARGIMGAMGSVGGGLASGARSVVSETHVHFHTGVLVASDYSVKKFSKEINKHIVANNQRTGIA